MPVSKAQQKSVNKYVKEKYDRINITMPKGKKELIQAKAAACGLSANAYINAAIEEKNARDGAGLPAGIPIPPPLESGAQAVSAQVKAHITKTGEDAAAFLERATESTIKRDEISLRMVINPATGEKEDLSNE